jgi:hypothetical protein
MAWLFAAFSFFKQPMLSSSPAEEVRLLSEIQHTLGTTQAFLAPEPTPTRMPTLTPVPTLIPPTPFEPCSFAQPGTVCAISLPTVIVPTFTPTPTMAPCGTPTLVRGVLVCRKVQN